MKFLKDAQANIYELVTALTTKIDEIDAQSDMVGADGLLADESSAAAESRVLK